MKSQQQLKNEVALYLAQLLKDEQHVLLGSGSTVNTVVQHLGAAKFVSSSELTSLQLQQEGKQEVPLHSVDTTHRRVCIDGADLVLQDQGVIIKGHGGALVREKITWRAASKIYVAIDESKLGNELSTTIPVATIPFASRSTQVAIKEIKEVLQVERFYTGSLPYHTDDGLDIFHLTVVTGSNLLQLHQKLKALTGVVETGLFFVDDYEDIEFICGTQSGIQQW